MTLFCLIFLPDRNDENTCLNKIEARAVFSIPILKNLAERITNSSKKVYCDEAIPIRQHGSATPLFPLPDGLGDISNLLIAWIRIFLFMRYHDQRQKQSNHHVWKK